MVKMYDYDMMTNEELVVLVRSRDSRAFEMLEHRFSRFILLKARKVERFEGMYREDVLQEAKICLYRACCAFDEKKGYRFMTFFGTLLNNHYGKMMQRCVHRPDPAAACIGLDENMNGSVPGNAEPLSPDEPLEHAINSEIHEALMESIRHDLTGAERRVVLSYLSGNDYADIASALGINEKSVDNALMRAKKKLRLSMAAYR
ncbi:MAG: sigma-70 family RNA polymerase sigma factor [Eubacteriales bacterium]|nr:sigma-70 family RNA polymerase sigma factor [Eubacteriales bacterium]